MTLPSLVYDYTHARIERCDFGPRREVTLTLSVLLWNGPKGNYLEGVRVRFGGIENFEEVSTFFAAAPHPKTELSCLRYAANPPSRPGHLNIEIALERVEVSTVVRCGSVQVSAPEASKS
jgi:hypothetical protein